MFENMDEESIVNEVWKRYEQGKNYFNNIDLITKTNENNRMYIGDQWYGLNSGGEKLPIFNIIKPIVKYKTAVIAQNIMTAVYSNMGDRDEKITQACEKLNQHFARMWELAKMDKKSWKIIKKAAIEDCSFLYFPGSDITKAQILSTMNVMLADEQNSELQEQEYIAIIERLPVNRIKKIARENKIDEKKIELIRSDENKDLVIGNDKEVQTDDGKCISILFMYKDDNGIVHYLKTTNKVMYQKDTIVQSQDTQGNYIGRGLRSYPIVPFVWEEEEGSARGCGEVRYLVNNQIELNKTLARRSMSIKQTAFARLVYNSMVDNPEDLDKTGVKIKVNDSNAQNINNMVAYLAPQSQSADAKNYSDEIMNISRDLAGAGDAVTGGVNPEEASGQAIIAAKDQAELPINEQVSTNRQFVEDVARVQFDIWVAYNPNGLPITSKDENGNEIDEIIPAEILEAIKLDTRVDVSQNSPYSKYLREQALFKFFEIKEINFMELIDSLDKDSNIPKEKLQDIIDNRGVREQEKQQLIQSMQIIKQYQELLAKAGINVGGGANEMQAMPA